MASPLTTDQDAALAALVTDIQGAQSDAGDGHYSQVVAADPATAEDLGVTPVSGVVTNVDEYVSPAGPGYVVRSTAGGKDKAQNFGPASEDWRTHDWRPVVGAPGA